MEKIKDKLIDWAEAYLAPILCVAYFDQISAVFRKGRWLAAKSVQRATIWYQYNLPRLVRPLYTMSIVLTIVTWLLGTIVSWYMTPKDAGTWPYWLWTAFDAVLLFVLLLRRYFLGTVKPMTEADVERRDRLPKEYGLRRMLGIDAPTADEQAEIEKLAKTEKVDLTEADFEEARKAHKSKFGDGKVMTPGMLTMGIVAPFILGCGLWMMASLSSVAGANWVMTAQYIFVGLVMGFISLFLAALLAVSLGTTIRVAGEIFISLFKGGWDSVITMLPNIEGEEAKELLPKDLGKHLATAWTLFTAVVLSVPGVITIAVLALAINWHYPIEMTLIALAFIGLTMSTLFSQRMGNDIASSQKRAGKIVAFFFLAGFLYRVAEGWWFGWRFGGTWLWMPKTFNNPLRLGWNMFVPWWNGLTHMSWWQALLVAVVLIIILAQIAKLPSGKWMTRAKYVLIATTGIGIAIVAIGFIANRASVDTSVSTVALIPTAATRTGETVVATAETTHVPDSIDEMTGAATPPPPPVVAAPPVVAPVVAADAHASTTTHRPTVEHPECVGLTPRFLARMQDRGLCP